MPSPPPSRITFSELAQSLEHVDPTARFVWPRVMRRIIKQHRRLRDFSLHVPHRKTYRIARGPLMEMVERDELGLEPGEKLPDTVHLIARPSADRLASMTAGDVLVKLWRLLFHLRVHDALEKQVEAGRLTAADVRRRIDHVGQVEFDEIRSVLADERMLFAPRSDRAVYIEFVAVYLELKFFAAPLLPTYFPSIEDFEAVDQIVADDLDAQRLFRETRPPHAPDPVAPADRGAGGDAEMDWALDELLPTNVPVLLGRYGKQLEKADKVTPLGNDVHAAILRTRAALKAPPEISKSARELAREDMERLVRRLREALALSERKTTSWRRGLRALVAQTPRGVWAPEVRILYDLQKVCVDSERELYTVDLVEWAVSLGRRPIRRPLPCQREVLMCRHLRRAGRRLRLARISENQRAKLAELLSEAVQRVEHRLREEFRPQIADTLEQVALRPQNVPERVAKGKLVEELLDRIVQRGFLTLGDLRDAVSRNDLKLPDRREGPELLRSDQLLQADRRLAVRLDGVYRRGEFYLRWLQRGTALAFGTAVGRGLTKYVALPFGGAYMVLAGLQQIVVAKLFPAPQMEMTTDAAAEPAVRIASEAAAGGVNIVSWLSVAMLGALLFGLLHNERFRHGCLAALKTAGHSLRRAWDWGLGLWNLPAVRRVLDSRRFRLTMRYVVKPGVYSALTAALLAMFHPSWQAAFHNLALMFLSWNLLLNSRLGRSCEELATDWIARAYHRFRIRVVAELVHLVVYVFAQFLDAVERVLYTVDEWLRFRSGESKLAMVVKAALGVAWFVVTYVTRFCITLLIEPQINPIKHFPVVTVSHKLLLPTAPWIIKPVLERLGLEAALAETISWTIVFGIPGIFGFLVWEMKENWRLFAANRSPALRPALMGHHGETMARLLRPGFHSGTIPKRYRRLRRAERRAQFTDNWKAARKHREALGDAAESIRRFTQRQFVALLDESRTWGPVHVTVGEIFVGSNSARIELACPQIGREPAWMAFQEQSSWLVGGVLEPGWIDELDHPRREALRDALAGFYKLAGVELVRQQIAAGFAPRGVHYDVAERGLVVWPDRSYRSEAFYDLRIDAPTIPPQSAADQDAGDLPTFYPAELIFKLHGISWQAWVETWERDARGEGHPRPILDGIPLLSAPAASRGILTRVAGE